MDLVGTTPTIYLHNNLKRSIEVMMEHEACKKRHTKLIITISEVWD